MALEKLPEDVVRFINAHITSIEHLEVLLLLAESRRAWTAAEVADKLCTTPASAANRLSDLARIGVLSSLAGTAPSYEFQPGSPVLADLVARLAQTYRERRISVINLIYSKPLDNIRTLSDAFRIRKKEDN